MSELAIKPADWLPHSGPMLMVSEVLTYSEKSIQCVSTIRQHNPLLSKKIFPCLGAIELFAQAAGLLFSLRNVRSDQNATKLAGAVVQLKSFEIQSTIIPVGSKLLLNANYIGGNEMVVMMEGTVDYKSETIFTGNLMIALFGEENNDA